MRKYPRLITVHGKRVTNHPRRRNPPTFLARIHRRILPLSIIFICFTGAVWTSASPKDSEKAASPSAAFMNSQAQSNPREARTSSKPSFYVIDGDTVRIDGETIRIWNIDTPEISQAKCEAELKLALEAKETLHRLLSSGPMSIRRGDPKSGRMKDRYGRTLAAISVGGRDVGQILIQKGHARPWTGKRRPWC